MAGAAKGYKVVIVMPETMSVERRKIIQALLEQNLSNSRGSEGMKGAIAKAEEMLQNETAFPPILTTAPTQKSMKQQQTRNLEGQMD